MEKKSAPHTQASSSPSLLGGFFDGAKSGAFNSTMMMGIFAGLSFLGHALTTAVSVGFVIPTLGIPAIALSVVATSIFSGAMGAKKAYDVSHTPTQHVAPVRSQARSQTRARQIELDGAEAPSQYRTDWAERTGRSGGSNVRQIIDSGSNADRDRAAAILEARENEMGSSAARS